MALLDSSIKDFAAVLASREPVPGGGGASALVGALGTAVLLFIGPLLTVLLREYAAAFFDTYWPMTLLTDSWGWRLTSPVMAGFDAARTGGWAILGAAAAAALLQNLLIRSSLTIPSLSCPRHLYWQQRQEQIP